MAFTLELHLIRFDMWSWKLPPKYFGPLFGILGSIIPQKVLMTLNLARRKPSMIFEFERDQFGCKIWTQRFLSPWFGGLLTIFVNCPNSVKRWYNFLLKWPQGHWGHDYSKLKKLHLPGNKFTAHWKSCYTSLFYIK